MASKSKKRGRPSKKDKGTKRGRGRPRKAAQAPASASAATAEAASAVITQPVPPVPLFTQRYSPSAPLVTRLRYDEGRTPRFKPVKPVPHSAKFQLPPPRPNPNDFDAVVMALSRVYLPDRYIMAIFGWTCQYIDNRNLNPRNVFKLVPRDILHFFAIIQYMGYCKLPAKADYWTDGDSVRGDHPICREFGMTYKKFTFLWRNIYLMKPRDTVRDEESEDEGDTVADEDDNMAFVVRSDSREDDYHFDAKARSIVDITNQGNKLICHHPSYATTIDEQMIKFQGRSKETYRMDNKPIPCGYKNFSIVDVETKFLWHMLPYGRKHTKRGTILTVKFLVETLPKRGELFYVCGMDNYFTYEKALKHCLDAGVHVVGTARARRGWPAPEIKRIQDARFNTLYHITGRDVKYVTYRWVDNNVVTLVSTLHDPKAKVIKARRKPRITQTNRNHVERVWGDLPVKKIAIPCVVDDYNHWKVAVDVFDQLLAVMFPDVRCHRTWMPLMTHTLVTQRVQSYIAHKHIATSPRDHKNFTLAWLQCLMRRAAMIVRATRSTVVHHPTSSSPPKRYRMSQTNPQLPNVRHNPNVSHVAVIAERQGK